MPINSENPTVVPAVEAATYDKYWVTNLNMMAMDPSKPVRLAACLKKARLVGNVYELMPNAPELRVVLKDLYAEAAQNASLASCINDVIAQIQAFGVAQEVLN